MYENLIQPEARLGFRDEAEVAAVLGGEQAQVRIAGKCGVIVDGERDQRIILGLHHQSGNADALQKLIGRLRGVVIVGAAEAKGLRREAVVKIVDVSHLRSRPARSNRPGVSRSLARTRSFRRATNRLA